MAITNLSLSDRASCELEYRRRRKEYGEQQTVEFTEAQQRYRDDPVGFVADCINWKEGKGAAPYQNESMQLLVDQRRLSLRGPHGLGKTALIAWLVLWFAEMNDGVTDWKVPITASAWRQLSKFAMPEIHKWARRLRWDRLAHGPYSERYQLTQLSLKLRTGEAFALASDDSNLIEGAHASRMLYIFDEAKEIPVATWDSAEGAFSTGDCYWISVSTPGEPQGRFYDIQSKRPGYEDWFVRHVTLAEAIAAGRVTSDWADARRRQWGEQSAPYQNRVLGEFASSEADGVIPLSWVEHANERWLAWKEANPRPDLKFRGVGVDVARSGEDKTVLALRFEDVITELRPYSKQDLMATTGYVKGVLDAHGGKAVIDVIGMGGGPVDRLREIKSEQHKVWEVVPFNASEHTDFKDKSGELGFVNCRSAAWWHLRELLDPDNVDNAIALPPDDLLTGDLVAPHWKVVSGGKIQVEAKEDIKERIGRSTDYGDAVVMVFFDNNLVSMNDWVQALRRHTPQAGEDEL